MIDTDRSFLVHRWTMLCSITYCWLLSSAAALDPGTVGFVEVKDTYTNRTGLGELLREAGAAAARDIVDFRDLTAEIQEGRERLDDLEALAIGSFATSDVKIRALFADRGGELRRFVERGGVLLVLSQADQDQREETWLPGSLRVTRSDRDYKAIEILSPNHALFSRPHLLTAAALSAWGSSALSWESMDLAEGAAVLAAQDRTRWDPWLLELGMGKGRALFLSWALDKLDPAKFPEDRKLAVSFLENFLAYAASVRRGDEPPVALPVPRTVTGTVFRDEDGDGARDPGEPGISGVGVSDGLRVVLTGGEGRYEIDLEPEPVPLVFVSIPAEYRKTHRFFRHIGEGTGDLTADFGLVPLPPGTLERSFVQVSDVHMGGGKPAISLEHFRAALGEASYLPDPPDFALGTGDLTDGSRRTEFAQLFQGMEECAAPFMPVIGNHDCSPSLGRGRRNWREFLGPDAYSFDAGRYHFLCLNTVSRSPRESIWIERDLALLRRGRPVIVAVHYPPTLEDLDEYAGWGVAAVASGHWHSNRVNARSGVLSVNTPTFLVGGIDLSPAGFRIWRIDGDMVRTEYRPAGVERLSRIVSPGGGILPGIRGEILANLFSSADEVESARFRLIGSGREIASGPLSREGPMGWRGEAPLPRARPLEVEVLARTRCGSEWRESSAVADPLPPEGPAAEPIVRTREDWPCFMGSPERRGEAPPLRPPFRLAWCASTGGTGGFASPIVASGRIFVSILDLDRGGAIIALDISTGRDIWRFRTEDQIWHSPAFAEGKVIAVEETGAVHAIEVATGKEVWRRDLVGPKDTDARWFKSAPAVSSGIVYAGNNARTAAIRIETGEILWVEKYAGDWICGYGSPALSGNLLIACGLWSRTPIALERSTGKIVWSAAEKKEEEFTIQGSPLIDGDLAVFGRVDAKISAHRLDTGKIAWVAPADENWVPMAPAASRGLIVFGSGTGAVRALVRSSGEVLWEFRTGPCPFRIISYRRDPTGIASSPTISGDLVYVGGGDGRLYALDLETGSLVWSHDFGAPVLAAPAISGNTLFAAPMDGRVYALVGEEGGR